MFVVGLVIRPVPASVGGERGGGRVRTAPGRAATAVGRAGDIG